MNDAVSLLPPKDSVANTLITLIAITGELPVNQATRLVESAYYLEKMITRLKKEKLIHTYYKNGLRGYRLTANAKRQLLKERPEQFARLFHGETIINRPKYTIPDRLRLHRMAEVMVTMSMAGITVYPWEKPALFENGQLNRDVSFVPSAYYTAGEIKEIGQEAAKVRGSRATGVLLTYSDDFIIYNTGNVEMEWKYQSEVRMKTLLTRELEQGRMERRLPVSDLQAIVLAADMTQMLTLTDSLKQSKHNYFVLDGTYKHFYYIPNNSDGEFLLQILCDRDLHAALDNLLTEDLAPGNLQASVENDGYDARGDPVLLAYTCDMPRIKRFDNALALQEKTGTLICFDFQEETMRQICGANISLQTIDTEALKGGIADQ